jgi:hypothetical protein
VQCSISKAGTESQTVAKHGHPQAYSTQSSYSCAKRYQLTMEGLSAP